MDFFVLGYVVALLVTWSQKSEFRPEAVLKLKQIAILSEYQGQGIGRELTEESLPFVKDLLTKQNPTAETHYCKH